MLLDIYNDKDKSLDVSFKDDNSPLTLADKTSNNIICDELNVIYLV